MINKADDLSNRQEIKRPQQLLVDALLGPQSLMATPKLFKKPILQKTQPPWASTLLLTL